MTSGTLYHSGHVLLLAKQAYERTALQRSEAEVCVALAAASFEGFLNEVAHLFRHATQSECAIALSEILTEAEEARLPPPTKFRLAVYALSRAFPRKGDLIVQQLTALFRIRNGLMHLRPEELFSLDEPDRDSKGRPKPPSEVELLISRKVVALPEKFSGTWRQLIATQEVARWAYNTTVESMCHLVAFTPEPAIRQQLEWLTNGLAPLPPSGA